MAKVVVRRWPLTLTLPLGASLAMFLVALATTQIALLLQEDREIRALESKAAIFLDAVADGVALSLETGPDAARDLLGGKLRVREALADEGLGLRWVDGTGTQHELARPEGEDPGLADLLAVLGADGPGAFRFSIADDGSRALAGRHYALEEGALVVAAALDTAEIHEARAVMERAALAATFILAGIAALLTYIFTRRALAPLPAIARELAADDVSDPAHRRAIAVSAEIGPLTEALAARREAEDARSAALLSTGEKERNALLAKLAAGLAHEVRNPLAGLLNAVSTLRRFGGDEAVRRETLDLIERGLRSISRVADTMLATYRPATGRMRFTREDLDDLQTLVGPEARRRQLSLDWRIEAMQPIAIDAEALRQILLNLLINACKVSVEAGRVGLSASQSAHETLFEIEDTGQGMPDAILAFLRDGARKAAMAEHKGLGLWMVMRLLEDLGGRVKVRSLSGEGTMVTVRIPVGPEGPAADAPRHLAPQREISA